MSINAIKELKGQVAELSGKLEAAEAKRTEEVESLKSVVDGFETSRKKTFGTTVDVAAELKSAKEAATNLHLKSVILGKPVDSFKEYKDVAMAVEKAGIVPTDLPNWLAEEFSNNLMEDLELELKVENLFDKIKMPENRQQFSIPARDGNLTSYLIAPDADAIQSAFATGKVTFSTDRFKSYVAIADQADSEAVIAVLDLAKTELVRSLSRGMEDALVNGDTAFATGNSVKKAFDGLRKDSRSTVVDAAAANITAAMVLQARAKMGVYGTNLGDLVLLANPNVAYQMLGLAEVVTVDKYGPQATIHTGEIGRIYGIPIVVTEYIADDLEADGADHDTVGVTTTAVLVNTRYFGVADRGSITVENDRNIVSSADLLVGFRDVDFKKLLNTASTVTASIINIKPAL